MDAIPGSLTKRFFITKGLPCIGLCVIVLGVFMFGAGVGVTVQEEYHAAMSSTPFQTASIVLLVAGVFSILAGAVEIYVTLYKAASFPAVQKGTLAFAVVLALAAVLAVVAGILGFVYIKKVNSQMESDLMGKLKDYGVTGKYETLANINRLQSKDKCCGVINYADWRNTMYGGKRYDKVPDSCCKEDKHGCGFEFEEANINKEGCLEKVKSSSTKHLLIVALGGIIVGLIETAFLVTAIYVQKKFLKS